MARNKLSVKVEGGKEFQELLKRLPALTVAQGGPLDRAVTKAGTIVTRKARQLAPKAKRGKDGRRLKQSKQASEDWKFELRKTITKKVVKYPTTSVAIVGPKSPDGNQAHFMQEKPRRLVLWGKATRVQMYRIARNWIVRAFDETRNEQQAAMVQSLQKDIDKIVNGSR